MATKVLVRMPDELKAGLERAAAEEQTSTTAVIVNRLQTALAHDTDAYRIGMTVGEWMQAAGEYASELAGGRAHWVDDPWCYQQALNAAVLVLDRLRPAGEPQPPEIRLSPQTRELMGEEEARRFAASQENVGFMVADYLLSRGRGNVYDQSNEAQAKLGPKLGKRITRKEQKK